MAVALLALGWLGYRSPGSAEAPSAPAPAPMVQLPAPGQAVPAQPPEAATESPAQPLEEVLPPVPRSALDTITGTVRVVLRLAVAPDGNVSEVASEVPGPSRYFERLSREAAARWRFSPASDNATRDVRVRFNYTRSGVTAIAEPLE